MALRLAVTFVFACLSTFLLIWILMPAARRLGLVDLPNGRKLHSGEVPTIGGIAIVAAVIETALLMGFADDVHPAFWTGLIVIVLVGTLDDLRDLGPRSKFVAQISAAALMVFWAGMYLHTLGNLVGNWPLILGVLAIPFTLFAVIGVINSVNFTDGADGLAGGLVYNGLLWLVVVASLGAGGAAAELQVMLAFLGAIGAFLMFNLRLPHRRKALIFLGDAGSLGLGFVLAWFMVWGVERHQPLFAPVTAIWLLAVPLGDTLTCAGRRLLNGTSPFKADRKHLHHILVDMGLPIEKAVKLIHGSAFVLAAIGVAGWHYRVPDYMMFFAAMGIFAAYVVFSGEALRVIEERRSFAESHSMNGATRESAMEPRGMLVGMEVKPAQDAVALKVLAARRAIRGGHWVPSATSAGPEEVTQRLTDPAIRADKMKETPRRQRSGQA